MADVLLDNPRAKECMHETLLRLQELQVIADTQAFERYPRPRSDTIDSATE